MNNDEEEEGISQPYTPSVNINSNFSSQNTGYSTRPTPVLARPLDMPRISENEVSLPLPFLKLSLWK